MMILMMMMMIFTDDDETPVVDVYAEPMQPAKGSGGIPLKLKRSMLYIYIFTVKVELI